MPYGRIPQQIVVDGSESLGEIYENRHDVLAHRTACFRNNCLSPDRLFGALARACVLIGAPLLMVSRILLGLAGLVINPERVGEQAYEATPPVWL